MCGLTPGEIDPSTGRKVRLHIGHIKDKSLGGKDELSNLRALCSTCNQGAKNITGEKPTAIWLLSHVRRAGQDEQTSVLNWLLKKFEFHSAMADVFTRRQRSILMARIRSRGNLSTEIRMMSLLRGLGLRAGVNWKVFGRPDFVFPADRIAVFVDGASGIAAML